MFCRPKRNDILREENFGAKIFEIKEKSWNIRWYDYKYREKEVVREEGKYAFFSTRMKIGDRSRYALEIVCEIRWNR